MAVTDSPEIEARAADRIVFFSDAVVAIAITLLALALPVPATTDKTTNLAFLGSLGDHWDDYLAFFISFLVVGSHWTAHRSIFRYVNRVTDQVVGTNMVWLLMVVLTPFAARAVSAHGGAFGARFGIYALIQAIASTCLVRMSGELSQQHLLRPDAPESARHPDNALRYASIAGFLISIPVAFVTPAAYAVWAIVPGVFRSIRRRRAAAGLRER
jgi:uncharacterized membrane protein